MWFNTYTYALFLPVVLALYALLPKRGRQIMLLGASYVFYCWELPYYGLLLVVSTVLDYNMGLLLERTQRVGLRRLWLGLSLLGNLGLLGFYKYADFLGGNVVGLGRLLGFEGHWEPLGFILPAGISFYTFQTISYTFQVYRRQYPAERDLLSFSLFVSFFPQLVAGPIERATHLLPQLNNLAALRMENIRAGLCRILIGLFRKMVIADRLAIVVNGAFSNPDACSPGVAWLALACFYGQIYFDFAGYADMAIGSARLFGVNLLENFRRPIMGVNITDWWNRWHMTLTGWFRDYLFNSLGGFRKGNGRAMLNAVIVLFLCGLWHGARWNFALWGLWNASMLIAYYLIRAGMKKYGLRSRSTGRITFGMIGSHALIFFISMVAALFFRSPDLPAIWTMTRALLGLNGATGFPPYLWFYVALLVGWYVVEFAQEHGRLNERCAKLPAWARAIGWGLLVVFVALGSVNLQTPYLYFQF
ncbi:MAG TPA: MBOAT family O-acyltransferase [Kiritimatiellia bacterium]|nr:MBOAT family O-acyltransferase [Kiritimatiellia bacterium]